MLTRKVVLFNPNVSGLAKAWTPTRLFADGTTKGAWYDPRDLATMFQNSNGTGAVAVGDPVGYIADKSGNGYHAIQATAGARPVLRQDAQGRYYLEADGIDDILVASIPEITINRGLLVSAAQLNSTGSTGADHAIACGHSVDPNPLFYISRNSTSVQAGLRGTNGDGTASAILGITTDADGRHVFSGIMGDVSGVIRMDGADKATGTSAVSTAKFDRIAIMGLQRSVAANWAPGRFYGGVVVFRAVTAQEVSSTESYLT